MIMVCNLCELCEKTAPISGHFFTTTNKNVCDVMIVGDFPKEEDLKNRRVFSGAIGTELAKLINQAKIDINNVYVTTLIKGRPVAPNGLDGRMRVSHVNACQINLIEEIATVNPKIIVLFGDAVFKYFYPKESFTDNRGKILTNNAFKIPTIATYHPMAMLGSAKFDQLIRADFATAGNFLKPDAVETHTTKKDYRFVVGSLDFLEKVAKRVKEIPTFAFDIETHGTGLFNYKLLSVGLSWKEHTGVSIPVYVKDESICTEIQRVIDYVPPERQEKTQVTLKNGTVKEKIKKIKGWTEEDTRIIKDLLPSPYKHLADNCTHTALKAKLKAILDQEPPLKRYWGDQHNKCMALLKEIFECDTPKGAHNGSYDVNRLRGKGIIVKNYAWDTILEHHLIDEERPHGLDDLSFVYTKDGGYKSNKNIYLASSKTSWANIPTEVLLPYNAQDADVTFQLHNIFVKEIQKSPKRWDLYMKHVMPAQRMLCDMEFRGSDIDVAWIKKTQKEYAEQMQDLKIQFSQLVSKVVPDVYVVDSPEEQKELENQIKEEAAKKGIEPKYPNFLNMNSVQQLVVLFRDYYKVPLTKKTKSGDALDANVLKKIGKKNKAASVLLEYKKLKKLESTYLSATLENIDADHKLHTQFLLYGTKTSRTSSRNPNLQNVPKEMKFMFIPPKGHVCVNVDQSAAELHVLAWLANDRKMIDIFENKRDLHRETAAQVFNKKMEDVTDEERKIAKRCFSSDSFILTEDGYIRGQAIGNRKVYTLDGKLQSQRHVFEARNGYKITLRNGMQLKVTNDHKFLDFTHVTPTWKEANCLKIGDRVGFRKEVPAGKDIVLPVTYKPKTKKARFSDGIKLDEYFAYFLGIYLSDGSMVFDKNNEVSKIQFIGKYGSRDYIISKLKQTYPIGVLADHGKYSHYVLSSKEVAQVVYNICGAKTTKHIPDVLFMCKKEIVDAFISGLIDGDGSTCRGVIRFRNKNQNLVRGLCKLATLYGYSVVYNTEKYDTTIKMNKDLKKRYTGDLAICTFVSKPDLTLHVETKAEAFKCKSTDNHINTWNIALDELKPIKGKCKITSYNNYRDGHQKGLTDKAVKQFGFVHQNYWASEIVAIEETEFEALIMETDTHFFIGEGLDTHNCSFGTAYGISGKGLAELLEPEGVKISESQGNKYIDKWRDTYPNCARYLDNSAKNFVRYGYLETPFGRRRHKYKKFYDASLEAASSRQASNFPIQSTASDIQIHEMVTMYKTLVENGVLPVFTVHDSIVMYCPYDKLQWLRDFYKKETCRRFPEINNLLMYTEMEVGRNYGEHIKLPYDCDFEKWKTENSFLFEQLGGGTNG